MVKNIIYPDEQAALRRVDSYLELNGKISKKNREALYLLSSYSNFLGRAAINDPELISNLPANKYLSSEKFLETYKKEAQEIQETAGSEAEFARNMRRYKYRELALIIYKNIVKSSDFLILLRELSSLSESIISAVFDYYANQLDVDKHGNFFVLAMGKLGGRLLNLSSDVDLIYIYKASKDNEVFFKLAEKMTKAISLVNDNGFLYRVDLNLRPGGTRSSIAVSYDWTVDYYFYWGDTWERAAFIQARPIAGDIDLGKKFINEIDRFVYRKSLDYESIEDLKDMKLKLNRLEKQNDVKLGKGGIREIEFFVQANQLVNSGQFSELKGKNTLECLELLAEKKIVSEKVKSDLKDSYIFLRKVEHNIQLVDERQTHKIPTDKNEILKLAKRTGFKTTESFQDHLASNVEKVLVEYNNLFYEPSKKVEEYANDFWKIADFLTEGNVSDDEAIKLLGEMGFKDPAGNLDLIYSLVNPQRAGLTQKGRMLSRRVIPALLSAVRRSYDSSTALKNLERFISSIGCRTSVYSALIENPSILNLLSMLFSTSGMLSNFLIRYPEYLNILTIKSSESQYSSQDVMINSLRGLVEAESSYEEKLNALRHFKHVETLKLCLRDIGHEIDPVYVGKHLSMIASAVVKVALELAISETKFNIGSRVNLKKMLILAMGKFAAREMSYNSDLDLIFIYEGDNHEVFSRLGQRLISILSVPTSEGFCYKIDLDLRPSGRSGTLVTSFDSFKKYHEESAQLWERQSLIRSFPSGGDTQLSRKVERAITKFVYFKPLEPDFYKQISFIRHRMENELAKETVKKFNMKTGRGGLVDIEFIVQMLQLRYGREYKSIRLPNTLEAIDSMKSKKLFPEKHSKILNQGYLFLKGIENKLRLLRDKSISEITDNDFDVLSVESDKYGSGAELKLKYLETTDRIRKIYKGYFES